MATRRAIVIIAGQPQELPLADVLAPDYLAAVLLADAAFANAAVNVATASVPANKLAAGERFGFELAGSVINTTTASNLVISLLVNGVVAVTATVALGITAFATPGRGFEAEGVLTLRTVGAGGTLQAVITSNVNGLASVVSNLVAAIAVNTTAAVTLALQISTSAATSTGTLRQGYVAAIN